MHCPALPVRVVKTNKKETRRSIPCYSMLRHTTEQVGCFGHAVLFTVTSMGGSYTQVLRGVVSTTSEGGFHRASVPCMKGESRTQRVESTAGHRSIEQQNCQHWASRRASLQLSALNPTTSWVGRVWLCIHHTLVGIPYAFCLAWQSLLALPSAAPAEQAQGQRGELRY
jgi:hypothetical protein